MDNCTVGALLKLECHSTSFTKKTGLLKLSELSAKDRNLLEFRTGNESAMDSTSMEGKPRVISSMDTETNLLGPRLDSEQNSDTSLDSEQNSNPSLDSEQNNELQECTIGSRLSIRCHLSTHTQKMGLRLLRDYQPDEINLLELRTGLQAFHPESTICLHHDAVFFWHYTVLQNKCCNPFGFHKKTIKTMLIPITEDFANLVAQTSKIILVPGQKLCHRCVSRIKLTLGDNVLDSSDPASKIGEKKKESLAESGNDLVSRQSFEEKHELETCTIGFRVSRKCPLKWQAKPNRLLQLRDLPATERNVLGLRTGLEDLHPESTICFHHKEVFLKSYSKCQAWCCNPFGFHKRNVHGNTAISEDDATCYAIKYKIFLVPGQKICSRCNTEFTLALEGKQTVQVPVFEEDTNALSSVNIPKSSAENISSFSELKQRFPSLTHLRKRRLLNSLL